ncbi:helix-turn-helix domain-containing protein [Candidatus Woesearchaeota archaeon]|nr:helix-turn-helix domain-containing protein [Candidatus Woesearchaeota archaeon]HIH26144.1 helix-turn-helix domain-containing protein [Nanoarchaeota archaeon]
MEMPQEIEVWYIIPAIRKQLAFAMKDLGLNQTEIAKRMGITKSAINQYLNSKRAKDIVFSDKVKLEVSNSASKIKTPMDTIREIQYLITVAKKENVTCQVHMLMDKNLTSKCDICFVPGEH